MPTLKNPRHELFAQSRAKGMTLESAYRAAGYEASGKSAIESASRLSRNVNVFARVAELQGVAAKKAVMTVTDIVRQLDDDRALAYSAKQAGAAVSASMAQAKVLGLITDKHMVGMKRLEDMNEDELRALLGESDVGSRKPG